MDLYDLRRARRRRDRFRRRLALTLAAALGGAALLGFAAFRPARASRELLPAVPASSDLRSAPWPREQRTIEPAPARPPQFLVVSFDGSGGVRLWPYWREVARRAHAHFTFFVSGVYLLDEARRAQYRPPRHRAGASDIGFAQADDGLSAAGMVRGMLQQLALAYGEGHELGTHFNGHFCAGFPGSVGEWDADDWGRELSQFDRLLFRASKNNDLEPAVRLPFGPDEVVGGRTPCLEGDRRALFVALGARGFRYDASGQAAPGTWPWRRLGLWEVPLQEIPLVGHTYRVLSMDYNLFVNQTAAGTPDGEIEEQAYQTLWRAFASQYRGRRAPLSFASHFETWNGGAYNRALARVVERACALPEVRCASFRELVDWLDAQPPGVLRRYERGRFPIYRG